MTVQCQQLSQLYCQRTQYTVEESDSPVPTAESTILSEDSDGAVSGEGKSLSGTTNSDRSEQVHSETIVTRTGEVTRTINERPFKFHDYVMAVKERLFFLSH